MDARTASYLEREVAKLRRQTGNLPARWANQRGAESTIKFVRVTAVPTTGRGKYTSRQLTYSAPGSVLTGSLATASYDFYNLLEASGGTAFLLTDDEVVIFKIGAIWVCSEIPRGYVAI